MNDELLMGKLKSLVLSLMAIHAELKGPKRNQLYQIIEDLRKFNENSKISHYRNVSCFRDGHGCQRRRFQKQAQIHKDGEPDDW